MCALPNTLLIGAAKAGTTSLCDDLERHPDIYFYHSKETHFFSFNYDKGIGWYESLFTPAGETIVMEGSPEYAAAGRSEEIAARIHAHLPRAKLIYMVRDPMVRIPSMYRQELSNGRPPISFSEALDAWQLVDGSLYEKNFRLFADRFGEDRIFVVFLEDYMRDKRQVLAGLLSFLGLEITDDVGRPREARNTGSDRYLDPAAVRLLRRMPGYYRYKGLLPAGLKARLRSIWGRKVTADVSWDPDDRAAVLARIRPDAAAFLERFGKDRDFWPLD